MPRVATFNVRHCRGTDGVVDIDRTARAIVATGAGFIALQEIDRGRARSGDVDQPARIAQLTGLQVRFWPTLGGTKGEYGLAVASAQDLEAKFRPLPTHGEEEPRGAIVARWKGISLVAVHLAKEMPARRLQLAAVAELAAGVPAPVVIVGDLNAGRRELGPLVRAGFDRGPRLATRPWRRLRQIDYVLPGEGVVAERVWTIRTGASDHLPVVADLVPGRL